MTDMKCDRMDCRNEAKNWFLVKSWDEEVKDHMKCCDTCFQDWIRINRSISHLHLVSRDEWEISKILEG